MRVGPHPTCFAGELAEEYWPLTGVNRVDDLAHCLERCVGRSASRSVAVIPRRDPMSSPSCRVREVAVCTFISTRSAGSPATCSSGRSCMDGRNLRRRWRGRCGPAGDCRGPGTVIGGPGHVGRDDRQPVRGERRGRRPSGGPVSRHPVPPARGPAGRRSALPLPRHLLHTWRTPKPGSTGVAVDDVHFHELADWDSVADIVGCGPLPSRRWGAASWSIGDPADGVRHGDDRARPHAGPGACHRPAAGPATGWSMTGCPANGSTPTGAALLVHLQARQDGRRPSGTVQVSGHGLGTRTLEGMANILRVIALDNRTGRGARGGRCHQLRSRRSDTPRSCRRASIGCARRTACSTWCRSR